MKVFDDPLAAQGIESDYYGMQKEVTEQREIWKANKGFKGDPEGRQNWDRKNRQIIGYAAQNSGDLQELLSSYEGDLYDLEGASNTDVTFVTNLAKYSHNRDFKSGGFNDQATAYMKQNPKATPEQLWGSLGKLEPGTMVKYKDPETGEHTYISNVSPPGLLPGGRPTVVTKKSSELKEIFNLKATGAHAGVQEMLNGLQTVSGNSGGKSYETFETNYKNELDTFIDSEMEKNDHTLRFLMRQKTGAQKMSFEDALRSGKAPMSAEIIATLGSVAGFEGDDGDGVLDAGDFATQDSYDAMVESILSGEIDKDLSKDLYIQHTSETVFRTGWDQYKKTPKDSGTDIDIKGGKFGGFGSYEFSTGGTDSQEGKSINYREAIKRRERLQGGLNFKGEHGHWKPTDDGNYTGEYDNLDQVYSPWEVADIESLWQSGESEDTFNKVEEIKEEEKAELEGSANLSLINIPDMNDDDAAIALNNRFELGITTEYRFAPYAKKRKGQYGTSWRKADAGWTDDIMLVLKNGERYKENGKVVRFKTGTDAIQEDIDKINEILGYKIKKIKTTSGGGGVGSKYNTVK